MDNTDKVLQGPKTPGTLLRLCDFHPSRNPLPYLILIVLEDLLVHFECGESVFCLKSINHSHETR